MSTPTLNSARTPTTQLPDYPLTKLPNRPSPAPSPPPILPYILPRTLTLLIGDPGIGKSLLATNLAAYLSHLTPLPPSSPNPNPNPNQNPSYPNAPPNPEAPPADSIPPTSYPIPPAPSIFYFSAEDSLQTLRDRARAAHANTHNLRLLTKSQSEDFSLAIPDPFSTGEQDPSPLVASLLAYIHTRGPISLLILDPLPAFLLQKDCYVAATVRKHLEPLLQIAEDHNFSILGIMHLAKPNSANRHPLQRILGSRVYPALARSILYATNNPPSPNRNPNPNPNPNQNTPVSVPNSALSPQHSVLTPPPSRHPYPRLVIPLKNNLLSMKEAYPFTVLPSSRLSFCPDPLTSHPLLQDGDAPPAPLPDPLEQDRQQFRKTQLTFAKQFLQTALAQGPILSTALLRQSREVGLSPRTLNRARYDLQIATTYNAHEKKWYVALPEHATTTPSQ